jgi:lipid-A-disaccharide synthase
VTDPAHHPNPAEPPGYPRIALVAGEASGDGLGADLIHSLRTRYPNARFAGIGGVAMASAGMEIWRDCGELSVMGLAEVLLHLPRLLRLRRNLIRAVLDWQPDVFIGIDAPDFNLGIERTLKRAGVRTVHYVSPSIWAWRESRAARIGESADRVLCLFPLEPPIYARHHVDARFVGHPLADRFPLETDRRAAREALCLPSNAPVLAVLPGSRVSEVKRLTPIFVEALGDLLLNNLTMKVVAPMANAACRRAFEAAGGGNVARILDGQAHEAMIASDLILLASGTAALEALLAKRPMVVAYRISPVTAWLVRRLKLMKTRHYSLPNVLAGEALVPELLQEDCTPENITAGLQHWLDHPDAIDRLTPRFLDIHEQLRQGASERAADVVAELLP